MSARVLGIDPGTAVTGYAVVDYANRQLGQLLGQLIECGVIRTNPRQPISRRLDDLFAGVTELIERHDPTVLAVESIFYGQNVRTTVSLGHARGVILLAGTRAGVEIAEFTPATVKKSVVGNGGATKQQVGYMVQRLLKLRAPPKPADASDACAIALTHLIKSRSRI